MNRKHLMKNKKPKKTPNVVDLFSGCGGLSFGLEKAGFNILLGIDNWGESLQTFKHNHPGAKILEADISEVKGSDIKKLAGGRKIDLVVGGPPCQGFSLSGPRNFYDKRNRLYLDFVRIVRELRPRAFIIENVPGLGSLFGGKVRERIIEEFSKMGYKVESKVLNAAEYGVPQSRRRIIFVGLKKGPAFRFPDPTHSGAQQVSVREAIGDLPILEKEQGSEEMNYRTLPASEYQRLARKGSNKIFNHVASNHSKQTAEIVALVPEGKNYKSLPQHLINTRNFHVAWTRLHRDKPSPTIDTGHRHHFHPTANRVPTVREAARIQSFPDTFKFLGSKTSQYKQVGNAVPPLLAMRLGQELLKYI